MPIANIQVQVSYTIETGHLYCSKEENRPWISIDANVIVQCRPWFAHKSHIECCVHDEFDLFFRFLRAYAINRLAV